MTAMKRINVFVLGIFKILFAVLFAVDPEDGVDIILLVLAFSLLLYGIKMFVYYFSLAQHMNGGLTVLYRAAVIFDLGLFAMKMPEFPVFYLTIYLVILHGFDGIAAILKALESKRLEAPSWKLGFSYGTLSVFTAVLCLILRKSVNIAVVIYALGLMYSGTINIVQSIRKTASIYVQ